MKRLSIWASTHRKLSWAFITICHIVIYYSAMYTGALLDRLEYSLPASVLLIVVFTGILSLALYPKNSFPTKKYALQKACDFTIGLSIFGCLCFIYNDTNRVSNFNTYTTLHGSFSFSKEGSKKDSTQSSTKVLTNRQLRLEKKQINRTLYQIKKEGKYERGNIVFGILGILVLTFLGLTIVASLSCSLSCNGAQTAGALVGIVGIVGVLWLAVWGIKRISRKKSEKEKINN